MAKRGRFPFAGATPAWIEWEEPPARWGGIPYGNTLSLREREDEPIIRGGWAPPKPKRRRRHEETKQTDDE